MTSFHKNYFDNKELSKLKTTIATKEGWDKKIIRHQISTLDIPRGVRNVYEIGCGIGRLIKPLKELGYDCWGCDASKSMVEESKEYLGINRVSLCSGEGKIPTNTLYDFVFSWTVFQHIPSTETVLKYMSEAKRILRKGGQFHFQILSKDAKHDGILWNVHNLNKLIKHSRNLGFKEVSVKKDKRWVIVKLRYA